MEDAAGPERARLISELKLAVPWGHIAAKAWGSHQAAPVLCLHGWLDNANSFDRLIPLLPKDFHYIAMDFGGHGLSSHYSRGFPYYHQNFVSEVRRVAADKQETEPVSQKWNRFSLLGHSFGATVGGMFSCIFPEMVDKLILLDALPVVLDMNLSSPGCTRSASSSPPGSMRVSIRADETAIRLDPNSAPSKALGSIQCPLFLRFLKNNSDVGEACGKHLLQRGTTQVATGLRQELDWGSHSVSCLQNYFLMKFFQLHAPSKYFESQMPKNPYQQLAQLSFSFYVLPLLSFFLQLLI
ncbi:hypothetical protein FD755_000626 [Muntiacus reevesi]|uniref:AB hydrolase-1 domain-containing protein n=1 Tax=Muntiacus reevesi TaxID=9886 RepID=A0A5J5N532_MUNRE|nr:hypothetical protein FD755_000626 [Muntiacus reevesi]